MRLQFPEGFLLGVSSASAQIEGGEVGSSWNDWYHQGRIKDGSDPAVADDHWNRWREDCALMAGLHLPIARMGVEWARIMGVSPAGIRISQAKTRFGSCSATDCISYSCRLMAYPEDAVDYVVVHELAHIRHKDHSPAFYAFVARFLPDYRRREAILRPKN